MLRSHNARLRKVLPSLLLFRGVPGAGAAVLTCGGARCRCHVLPLGLRSATAARDSCVQRKDYPEHSCAWRPYEDVKAVVLRYCGAGTAATAAMLALDSARLSRQALAAMQVGDAPPTLQAICGLVVLDDAHAFAVVLDAALTKANAVTKALDEHLQ